MTQQPYFSEPPYPGSPNSQPGFANPAVEPPLDQPWYGIGFMPAVKRFFKKYATFTGRASRGEYWWFFLFNGSIGVILSILLLTAGMNWAAFDYYGYYYYSSPYNGFGTFLVAVSSIYSLACIVPGLALAVRRLHDIGKSGVWYCVVFIPFAGVIWLYVMLATRTYPGPTQWDIPSGVYAPQGYEPQGYAPQYPPQGYPPQEYPPQAQGYSPYPPQNPGYPPQGAGYPPQNPGYPPQGTNYPPQGTNYPPQGGYPQG